MLIRSTLLISTRIRRALPSPDDSRRLLITVPSDRTRALISFTLWYYSLTLLVFGLSFGITSGRLNTDDCPSILDLHIT